jgi:hypothetical protein
MRISVKNFAKVLSPLIDLALIPAVYPAAYLLKSIRTIGLSRMPLCKQALLNVGVFPLRNHYYEPLFDYRLLKYPLDRDRCLPGIDWNVAEQLALLDNFRFSDELKKLSTTKASELSFHFNNGAFESGDAEFFYNLIRLKKPARIFEVGSGNSTLLAMMAIRQNKAENPAYDCKHVCIEPYEMPWLEKTGVTVLRQRVEEVDKAFFKELVGGDILFIDSSHVIRPQGDVLFEYLELLPSLNNGVIVHVHDVFSPKDYIKEWIENDMRLWNEQYLLEAFLTCNQDWKIVGALNFLKHGHFDALKDKCPFLTENREPGSFYIEKVR